MNGLKHIHALVAIMALLVSLVAVPTASAAASHGCCPPDMAMSMNAAEHQMAMQKMAGEGSNGGDERPCDFSCCGIAPSMAVQTGDLAALISVSPGSLPHSVPQSQLASAALGIQPPPPKS